MTEQNNQDALNFLAIETYYNDIASNYDQWRFGNSYGKYIDYQERAILNNWLRDLKGKNILDLGCGTGIFLDLANTGLDIREYIKHNRHLAKRPLETWFRLPDFYANNQRLTVRNQVFGS